MDWERRCIRLCAGILLLAVTLRLASSGVLAPVGDALTSQRFTSFLVYLYTGRTVRLAPEVSALSLVQTQPEETESETDTAVPTAVSFSPDDLSLIGIKYNCSYDPDLQSLLTQPLAWNLTDSQPTVLIVHTHTTESYTKSAADTYEETSAYRTLDPQYNMLCLGELVAQTLEDAGIGVIHDTTFHDYPSYNGSYSACAKTVTQYLEEYPSITLVLDLHRDAAATGSGQLDTSCTVDGEESAQIMMVVGTSASGLNHPQWQENLALALKLQVLLEQENPGICREINLAYQRYNQHLGDRALLIEIGAAGNTLAEAKIAARELAEAIIRLSAGAQ